MEDIILIQPEFNEITCELETEVEQIDENYIEIEMF